MHWCYFYYYSSCAPLSWLFSFCTPFQWTAFSFFWETKMKRKLWSLCSIFPHCGCCAINLMRLFVHNLVFSLWKERKKIQTFVSQARDYWTHLIQKHFNVFVWQRFKLKTFKRQYIYHLSISMQQNELQNFLWMKCKRLHPWDIGWSKLISTEIATTSIYPVQFNSIQFNPINRCKHSKVPFLEEKSTAFNQHSFLDWEHRERYGVTTAIHWIGKNVAISMSSWEKNGESIGWSRKFDQGKHWSNDYKCTFFAVRAISMELWNATSDVSEFKSKSTIYVQHFM